MMNRNTMQRDFAITVVQKKKSVQNINVGFKKE